VDLPVDTRVVTDQPVEEPGASIDAPEEVVHG
jgi:hypothetical protein